MKVFCLGFHKTGTSSLGEALEHLGYNVCGNRRDLSTYLFNNDLDPIFEVADQYDAFQDMPWPLLYQELDKRYPGSKFILTQRDEDRWLRSLVKHCQDRHSDLREWIYGYGNPKGHEQVYRERYRKHYEDVLDYFQNRSDDLLVLSLEDGDEWHKICNFLGHSIPDVPFPHFKKSDANPYPKNKRQALKQWLADKLRRWSLTR